MKRTIISFLVGAIVTACAMGWFWYQEREQYTRAIPAVKGPIQVTSAVNGTPAGTTNGVAHRKQHNNKYKLRKKKRWKSSKQHTLNIALKK